MAKRYRHEFFMLNRKSNFIILSTDNVVFLYTAGLPFFFFWLDFVMAMSSTRLKLLRQFASFILQQFYNNEAAQSRCIRTSSKRNQSPVLSLADMNDLSSNRDASQCPRKNYVSYTFR